MEKIYEEEEKKEKRRVLWFSLALHLLVILFLFMPWYNAHAEDELKEQTGIFVQFSFDEGAAPSAEEVEEPVEKPAEEPKPASKPVPKEEVKKPKAEKPVEIKSKDLVETSEVVATKNEDVKPKRDLKAEAAAAKAKAEAEAKAAREAKEAKEAAERAAAEAKKQAEYEASKSKFSGLFGSGDAKQNDGSTSNGNPDGDPDANKLEGLTSGKGTVGTGLGGRGILFEPTIKDKSQKSGKVVIRVCVGPEGNVISKKFTQAGSTTTDTYLVDLALKNVSKYKFTKSEIPEQCGDIVIDFRLK